MRIDRVQRASVQFEHLNSRLGPALDPKHVRLPVEPAPIAFSKTAHGQELGESAFKC